jgi:hypothetical protein
VNVGSPIVGFFVLFPQVFDAGTAVVAVTDETEVFEDDPENEPESGEQDPDASGNTVEEFHGCA